MNEQVDAPLDMYVTFLCGGPRVGIFLDMANRLNARHNLTGAPVEPFIDGGLGNGGREYWHDPSKCPIFRHGCGRWASSPDQLW